MPYLYIIPIPWSISRLNNGTACCSTDRSACRRCIIGTKVPFHLVKDRVVAHPKMGSNLEDIQRRLQEHSLHHIPIFIIVTIFPCCWIQGKVKGIERLSFMLKEGCFHLYQARIDGVIYITFVIDNLELIILLEMKEVNGIIKNLRKLIGCRKGHSRLHYIFNQIILDITAPFSLHKGYLAINLPYCDRITYFNLYEM